MTEAAALEALEYRLDAHRNSGHLVTRDGDTYLVTDSTGAFVQETVFLSVA